MRRILAAVLMIVFCVLCVNPVGTAIAVTPESGGGQENAAVEISAPSAVLMEGSTGEILYEKNGHEPLMLASVTKTMTLLLIFEALEQGKIKLTDSVSVSEHAASMGGSQVYLEPFETQTVNDMIKCISIASANDASVAMAEYIAGSEAEFVARMNQKAKELGMKNTIFSNCCGLDDDYSLAQHHSSAYDVALMSRDLITRFPQIKEYTTIWMDSITHVTKKGESQFGLTNTNKLVRTYDGITGLKTGSTSKAKYCLSATARRNGMDLIAVVMAAPEPKGRFQDASRLLDYGFANCSLFTDDNKDLIIEPVPVRRGVSKTVEGTVKEQFSYICLKGVDSSAITKEVIRKDNVEAPVKAGDEIGQVVYSLNGKQIGQITVLAKAPVEKAKFKHCMTRIMLEYFMKHEEIRAIE